MSEFTLNCFSHPLILCKIFSLWHRPGRGRRVVCFSLSQRPSRVCMGRWCIKRALTSNFYEIWADASRGEDTGIQLILLKLHYWRWIFASYWGGWMWRKINYIIFICEGFHFDKCNLRNSFALWLLLILYTPRGRCLLVGVRSLFGQQF